MNPSSFFRILFLAVALVLGVAIVRAEGLSAVKARMEQRLSSVDALKEQQQVGENNRGYLEARASLTPSAEKVVSDENADRRVVYAAIASQNGTNSDEVGRRRAERIAAVSKHGVWVQAPDGSWAQK